MKKDRRTIVEFDNKKKFENVEERVRGIEERKREERKGTKIDIASIFS